MTKQEYLIAIDEVNQIIQFLPEEERKKIPDTFIDFLKSEWKKGIGIIIKPEIELKQQNISKYTKALLLFICDKYFSKELD